MNLGYTSIGCLKGLAVSTLIGACVCGSVRPLSSCEISQILKEEDHILVRWPARVAGVYQVFSAPAVTGPWQSRGEVRADSESMTWLDDEVADAPSRFYQVVAANLDDCVTVEPTTTADEADALLAADAMPSVIKEVFETAREIAAEAAWAATEMAGFGEAVTTGTLTELGESWSYHPAPEDHLVVQFETDGTYDFWIQQAQGDISSSAAHFLDNDHFFQWRMAAAGGADLTFTSARVGRLIESTVQGVLVYEEVEYEIDVTADTDYFFESDSSGTHLISDTTSSGTVTAAGFALELEGRSRFELVTAQDSTGGGTSAAFGQDWVDATLTFAGDVYRFVDFQKQRNFKDGKPYRFDTDHWSIQGTVLKNDAVYGTAKKHAVGVGPSGLTLLFLLVLPGETVELESWVITAAGDF